MNTTTGEIPDTQNKALLFAKMARVMGKMSRIQKTGENTQQHYKFATESDIVDMVRTAMAEENLAFIPVMTDVEGHSFGEKGGVRWKANFLFTFADGETGATYSCPWIAESIDYGDKGINKVATAAVKYFLLKTFLISTGDKSDDADNESPDLRNQKPATPKKQQNGTHPTPPSDQPPKTSANGRDDTAHIDASKSEVDDEPFVLRANWIVPHETKDGKVYYETEGGATTYSRELFHQKAGYTEQDTALWPTQLDRRIDLFAPLDVFYKIVTSKGRDYKRIVDMKKIEPEASND